MISLSEFRTFFLCVNCFISNFFKSPSKHSLTLHTGVKHLIFSKGAVPQLILPGWNCKGWASGFEPGLSQSPPAFPGWGLAGLSPAGWRAAKEIMEGRGWGPHTHFHDAKTGSRRNRRHTYNHTKCQVTPWTSLEPQLNAREAAGPQLRSTRGPPPRRPSFCSSVSERTCCWGKAMERLAPGLMSSKWLISGRHQISNQGIQKALSPACESSSFSSALTHFTVRVASGLCSRPSNPHL